MPLKLVKNKSTDSSKILIELNPEQDKAVTTTLGPLLIIAGAGSGKTRVLTHRVAYLIEQGIPPYNILALTFTNKAAKEMQERIGRIVSRDSADKIWAGTFHSLFARILRYEAEKIGYTSSFSIYDTDDSLSVIKKIMNNENLDRQQYPPQGIRAKISWAKNQMINWIDYQESADTPIEKQTGFVYERYEKQLKQANAMDFDDLLINMIHLLRDNPDILEKYQNKFKYILVDEYQDTNRAQYQVINLLAKKHENICVVGDDAQSIYGWRGADIRNILEFNKDYPDVTVIRLEQNYRSTKTILAAADSVIKNNRKQLNKTLWTDNPDGELIEIINSSDDRFETEDIVGIIKSHLKNGNEYTEKDFAVLYRTNAQSLALENTFRKHDIPYVIIGGISFYKRKEIKDTLAYLKLLFNPKDEESLLRIVNEPPRGLGLTSLRHIKTSAVDAGIPLLDAFFRTEDNINLQNRAKNSALNFANFIKKYVDLKDSLNPSELALKYIEETGMLQMYREIGTSDASDRWNNIQQLLSDISTYFRNEPEAKFEDYLQQMALMSDIDEKDTSHNQVKLMTLHSAKGLEFPIVFIAGLEEGLFPLAKSEMIQEEEEEERRLLYVGMTRAEQKLYLTYANRRMRFGNYSDQGPSPFITEIDPKFLHRKIKEKPSFQSSKTTPDNLIKKKMKVPSKKTFATSKSKKIQPEKSEFDFKNGDMVQHSKFGKGKVLAVAGSGNNVKAVVHFNSVGKKVLMLQYAKLEHI
ncbi:ATP-dependent helicase [Bacteroidota bacterium]